MDEFEFESERTGDSLCSIVDLWEIVSDKLGITVKQAADFVEKRFKDFEFVLWIPDRHTGIFTRVSGISADGGRRDLGYFLDAWSTAEKADWSPVIFKNLKFLKLTPRAFRAIEADAEKIRCVGRNEELAYSSQTPKGISLGASEIDPSDLPTELDAANMAFRAITNGYGDQSTTPRNRLIEYLGKHYPDFKLEQVQRIATVANPDKTTGRKRSGKE